MWVPVPQPFLTASLARSTTERDGFPALRAGQETSATSSLPAPTAQARNGLTMQREQSITTLHEMYNPQLSGLRIQRNFLTKEEAAKPLCTWTPLPSDAGRGTPWCRKRPEQFLSCSLSTKAYMTNLQCRNGQRKRNLSAYVRVCIYVYMCVYMYICMYISIYIYTLMCITHIHAYIHVHMQCNKGRTISRCLGCGHILVVEFIRQQALLRQNVQAAFASGKQRESQLWPHKLAASAGFNRQFSNPIANQALANAVDIPSQPATTPKASLQAWHVHAS